MKISVRGRPLRGPLSPGSEDGLEVSYSTAEDAVSIRFADDPVGDGPEAIWILRMGLKEWKKLQAVVENRVALARDGIGTGYHERTLPPQ